MKVELNFVFVGGGDLSVMKNGQLKMLKWCVINLDSVQKVYDPVLSCFYRHVVYALAMFLPELIHRSTVTIAAVLE